MLSPKERQLKSLNCNMSPMIKSSAKYQNYIVHEKSFPKNTKTNPENHT